MAAARASGRDHSVDWASFTVHDLPGESPELPGPGAGAAATSLDLDPFAAEDPRVDALIARMQREPRRRPLGGFAPP